MYVGETLSYSILLPFAKQNSPSTQLRSAAVCVNHIINFLATSYKHLEGNVFQIQQQSKSLEREPVRLQGNKAGNVPQTPIQAGVTWLAAAERANTRKLK